MDGIRKCNRYERKTVDEKKITAEGKKEKKENSPSNHKNRIFNLQILNHLSWPLRTAP